MKFLDYKTRANNIFKLSQAVQVQSKKWENIATGLHVHVNKSFLNFKKKNHITRDSWNEVNANKFIIEIYSNAQDIF